MKKTILFKVTKTDKFDKKIIFIPVNSKNVKFFRKINRIEYRHMKLNKLEKIVSKKDKHISMYRHNIKTCRDKTYKNGLNTFEINLFKKMI